MGEREQIIWRGKMVHNSRTILFDTISGAYEKLCGWIVVLLIFIKNPCFHREREEQLMGYRKRGPKPKHFLTQVRLDLFTCNTHTRCLVAKFLGVSCPRLCNANVWGHFLDKRSCTLDFTSPPHYRTKVITDKKNIIPIYAFIHVRFPKAASHSGCLKCYS